MFIIVLILAFGAAFLIEMHLARRWNAGYCLNGFRIFRRECNALHPREALPRSERMEIRFMETEWPTLDFKWLNASQLAFHENYTGAKMAYTQVMRGYLMFNHKTGTVEVVGLLNYFVLFFLVAFLGGVLESAGTQELLFASFALLIVGACYAMQVGRYNEVLSAAAAEWGSPDG